MIGTRDTVFAEIRAKIKESNELQEKLSRIRENAKAQDIDFTKISEKYFKR